MAGERQRGRKRTVFLIYDSHARGNMGTNDSTCLGVEDSLSAARGMARDFVDAAIYKYDVMRAKLVNERWVEDSNLEGDS